MLLPVSYTRKEKGRGEGGQMENVKHGMHNMHYWKPSLANRLCVVQSRY